ncbi:10870_t:CDS:10, partial [Funneliformis geosporum]
DKLMTLGHSYELLVHFQAQAMTLGYSDELLHWVAKRKKMKPDTTLNIKTLQVEHQILTAGNSGFQNIDNHQRKHYQEETTDNVELEKFNDDEHSTSNSKIDHKQKQRKTKSGRIIIPDYNEDSSDVVEEAGLDRSNIRHESSTPSKKNDVEVDEIDMTLSENPIVERLMKAGGIGRYKIVFLPEENDCDAIKLTLNKNEWSKLETDWFDAEKTTVPSNSGMNENTVIVSRDKYSFTREWPTQWIKSVCNAFLLCFQLPINPLHDCNLSEYSYRDKIVNRIIEDTFLDTYNFVHVMTGEVENTDRKDQKNSARPQGQRRSVGWDHDAVIIMKANNVDYQIGFGEVVGNACIHDDKKMTEDQEKMLKAMQLGLFRLRKLLCQQEVDENGIRKAETFGILVYRKTFCFYSMHYIDGLYLVDQFEGFTIPDNSGQFVELLNIIEIMFSFKQRVMNLHNFVQSLFNKQKCKFRRRFLTNESAIKASPKKR